MTDEEFQTLKKKFFPRVAWTENGPVRRAYLVKPAAGAYASAEEALAALAEREGFTAPGRRTVTGGAEETLAAFRAKARGEAVGMVFGTELSACWCDAALSAPDGDGWQKLIVRSEEGENLVALAHCEGLLRFRRAE